MTNRANDFGRRKITPPPIVTHAPQGLAGGPEPPPPRQMRTLAITLGLVGAAAIGVFAAAQARNHRADCPPPNGANPNSPLRQSSDGPSGQGGGWSGNAGSSSSGRGSNTNSSPCQSYGGSSGHGGGWSGYSGSSSSSSSSSSPSSSSSGLSSASFGGFGHAGGAHGGGGGE